MLDFYAVHDLEPFPEDLPRERTEVGSMDIDEYHACAEVIEACLSGVGVEASYFSDWTVPGDRSAEVVACLTRRGNDVPDAARRGVATFAAILRRAEGRTLLAVCD